MQYTARCWGSGDKPDGTEYWSDLPSHLIEAKVRDWSQVRRIRRIEVRDEAGNLVARYPRTAR